MGVNKSLIQGSPDLTIDDRIKPGTPMGTYLCCYRFNGIPQEAELLSITEQQIYLDKVQGRWKIVPNYLKWRQGDRTDVYVEGNTFTLSGGIVSWQEGTEGNKSNHSAPIPPETFYFKFYKLGNNLYYTHAGGTVLNITTKEFRIVCPVQKVESVWFREIPVEDGESKSFPGYISATDLSGYWCCVTPLGLSCACFVKKRGENEDYLTHKGYILLFGFLPIEFIDEKKRLNGTNKFYVVDDPSNIDTNFSPWCVGSLFHIEMKYCCFKASRRVIPTQEKA